MMSMRPSPSRSAASASSQAIPPSSIVYLSNATEPCCILDVENEDARPFRPDCARLVRIALADDQFIISIRIQVGAPDGVAPLDRLGDHMAAPERPGRSGRYGKARCAWGGIHDHLKAVPRLDRCDEG